MSTNPRKNNTHIKKRKTPERETERNKMEVLFRLVKNILHFYVAKFKPSK